MAYSKQILDTGGRTILQHKYAKVKIKNAQVTSENAALQKQPLKMRELLAAQDINVEEGQAHGHQAEDDAQPSEDKNMVDADKEESSGTLPTEGMERQGTPQEK